MNCTTSPSQCVTIEGCDRRWWFENKAKLRLPDSKPQHFGHALHKVVAAHLMSQPLDPTWAEDLTGEEVERCLDFRDIGIKKGVLRARPNLTVEHDFRMPVGTDEMHGVIDVLDRTGIIEDHKVIFTEKYAKTEQDLLADIPMMVYGGYLFQIEPDLQNVVLRHNQFITDTMKVRPTEVTVSRANARAFWGARIIPLLARMDKARGVEQWEDSPGHDRLSPACTKYGGCPFHTICHGGLKIEDFGGTKTETSGALF